MDFEQILAWLHASGLPVERYGATTARSGFQGKTRRFPFFVHVDNNYLTFAAVPYAKLPPEEARANALMDRLLHLNGEINFARFSVDDDGDVVLSVEYPLADLDESEVRDALDVLCFYADKLWDEVSLLAGPLTPSGQPTAS